MKTKSFIISKWQVLKAYELVKANAGAAGVDQQSLSDFERNLKGNLYKLGAASSKGDRWIACPRTRFEIRSRFEGRLSIVIA